MGKSIMAEVNEYIQSQIKRELTGEELIRGSTSEGTTRGNLIFLDTVYKGVSLI